MAKVKSQAVSTYVSKSKKLYKHSKSESGLKTSKNYKKKYRGQGR